MDIVVLAGGLSPERDVSLASGCLIANADTIAALEEVEQMKKNPALGKAYTDVDQMMKELLA